MNTIKLNPGIEGAEVRDALQWIKRITEEDINRMKIGKTGLLFSFVDPMHVVAGKVFVPSTSELWHHEKEVGFNAKRLFNAFSIFRRKDKTELYVKHNRLFLKNGALKWRYDMEDVEAAQKIEFNNMPTPAISLRLEDILPLKQVNKGRRASEKIKYVAFKYGKGKATVYLFDEEITELTEVKTEGEGEGVAVYNLLFLEKLIKDAKAGIVRIEEDKPLKLNARTGKKTKAVLYLAPVFDVYIKDTIRGKVKPSPTTPAPTPAPGPTTTHKPKVEILKEGVAVIGDIKGEKIRLQKINGKYRIKTDKGPVYAIAKKWGNILCTWEWLIGEEEEREKLEHQFKDTEKVVEQWKEVIKKHPNLETKGFTAKKEDKQELREEVIKEDITFLTVREATGAQFHKPEDVYDEMKAEAVIDRECIWVLHLNSQNKVYKKELVAMGTGNAAQIKGREIFRRAIIEGATSLIMVHNHPGGNPEPSEADKVVCARIREAGRLLGVELLDFMVIATDGFFSFADKGLMDALRSEG